MNMLAGTFRGRLYYILRSNFLLPGSEFNFLHRNDKKNASQYRIAYYPGWIIFPVPYRRHLLANQREIGRRIQKQESFIGVSVHFRQFCSQRRKSSSSFGFSSRLEFQCQLAISFFANISCHPCHHVWSHPCQYLAPYGLKNTTNWLC